MHRVVLPVAQEECYIRTMTSCWSRSTNILELHEYVLTDLSEDLHQRMPLNSQALIGLPACVLLLFVGFLNPCCYVFVRFVSVPFQLFEGLGRCREQS